MENMGLLELINDCDNDEELKEVIDKYVDMFSFMGYKFNPICEEMKVIGRDIDINPKYNFNVLTNNRWYGFIPNDIKIVYGSYSNNKGVCNQGWYYYLNDNDYLYCFARFIKNKNIEDSDEFISYVQFFLNYYFDNKFNPIDREIIDSLILDSKGNYIPPTKEHDITDFKYKGSAKCSEYSVMAQNIMSLFGYNTMVIFSMKHAYNLFFKTAEEVYVLDYQARLKIYDIYSNLINEIPYMAKIENYSEESLYDVVFNAGKFEFDDIFFIKFNDKIIPFFEGKKRVYNADGLKLKRK